MVDENLEVPELASVWDQLPKYDPSLIKNMIKRYQKMMITGPNKSCKTALAIQLTIAVAEGTCWLQNECFQGEVLYLNYQVPTATMYSRFYEMYKELEMEPSNVQNISIRNMKGITHIQNEMDFANEVILLTEGHSYRLIVIDPIDYLWTIHDVEVAIRLNQALDYLMNETGACVVLTHTGVKSKESFLTSLCDTVIRFQRISESDLPDNKFLQDSPFYRAQFFTESFPKMEDRVYSFSYPKLEREPEVEEYLDWKREEELNMDSVEIAKEKSGLKKLNQQRQLESKKQISDTYSFCIENDETPTVHAIATHLEKHTNSIYRMVKKHNDFIIIDGVLEKKSSRTQ